MELVCGKELSHPVSLVSVFPSLHRWTSCSLKGLTSSLWMGMGPQSSFCGIGLRNSARTPNVGMASNRTRTRVRPARYLDTNLERRSPPRPCFLCWHPEMYMACGLRTSGHSLNLACTSGLPSSSSSSLARVSENLPSQGSSSVQNG